jgi:hypothetical protein
LDSNDSGYNFFLSMRGSLMPLKYSDNGDTSFTSISYTPPLNPALLKRYIISCVQNIAGYISPFFAGGFNALALKIAAIP